jgi:hypothetical protein
VKDWHLEILCVVLAYVLLLWVFWPSSVGSMLGGFAHHLLLILLALALGLSASLYSIRNEISRLLRDHKRIASEIRRPFSEFMLDSLEDYLDQRKSIISLNGMELDEDSLNSLINTCFGNCYGPYHGTDSNKPSEFLKLYPGYVAEQVSRNVHLPPPLRTRAFYKSDTRFLLVDRKTLSTDFKQDSLSFKAFYESNLYGDIVLLQVDPSLAKERSEDFKLPSTDLGVFAWKYVLFFSLENRQGARSYRVRMQPLNGDLRGKVAAYLSMLNKEARRIDLSDTDVLFHERTAEEIYETSRRLLQGSKLRVR